MSDFENIDKKDFEKHAVLQKEVLQRMMTRLKYFKIQPDVILNLKIGVGLSTLSLKKYYPQALVLGIDESFTFLNYARAKKKWLRSFSLIQASDTQLPLFANSVDLIVVYQWLYPFEQFRAVIQECFRVLKPEGCLLFSSLGPDSFKEIGNPWQLPLHDLHDIGDLLIQEGFLDPVMDREDIVLRYPSAQDLENALKAQGLQLEHNIQQQQITYEVIYGQAWRGNQNRSHANEQTITLETLRKSLKKSNSI